MSRTPRLTGSEVLKALSRFGFTVVRVKGSHHFLRHQDGRSTVVPVHSHEVIGPGLLHKIARDCRLDASELSDPPRVLKIERRKTATAHLTWLSAEEGGRATPPAGAEYSTVCRFAQEQTDAVHAGGAWSLVVRFCDPVDRQSAQVHFLAEQAPHEWLVPGHSFELLEGARIVARGRILGE